MAAFAPRVIAQKTKVVVVALAILAVAFVLQVRLQTAIQFLTNHSGFAFSGHQAYAFLTFSTEHDQKEQNGLSLSQKSYYIETMHFGSVQEDEAHRGGNQGWLMG
ncbi:hypothetical protein ElyMa_002966000 [Elysia marginata]|uniref:Uncharacterized protein n=1 Tax=Elysia marginata TaxID=1093978 RepID=A0AAV4I949_9GAST|nr:hypothetical protein ElyMa_002966000 [Elysia marginata]